MRWCIKMTNIRLGERNNFLRECVCSLKVYAAARPFHSVPCFSRRQPSFYGLFVFIPNLPISVSPLSNFPNKNAASAGMSQCSQIKFFTKSPWKKILKLPKLGINFQQDGCQDWTKRIFVGESLCWREAALG